MGAFLDRPKTEKSVESGEGERIKYGMSAMQGWRMEMEDDHVCNTDFRGNGEKWGFFGIFDGHAGAKVSHYCAENLVDCIKEKMDSSIADEQKRVEEGIKAGFLHLDQKLRDEDPWASGDDRSGTTAITVMVMPKCIVWANCGDSRGLVCKKDVVDFATEDHKPFNPTEKDRIERAGGTVMMQRVNGSLAVSRALGDFDYKRSQDLPPKEQLVSPEPDITVRELDDSVQFLFLACDGIYDVMSNEEVVKFILHRLTIKEKLDEICSELLDLCLSKNSRDNMSAILVTFPSAPQFSQEAADKFKVAHEGYDKEIYSKLEEYVNNAKDSLDVEDTYIIEQLLNHFSEDHEILLKRKQIIDKLVDLRKGKFDEEDSQGFIIHPSRDDTAVSTTLATETESSSSKSQEEDDKSSQMEQDQSAQADEQKPTEMEQGSPSQSGDGQG